MKKNLSNFGFIKSLRFLVRKILILTIKVLSSCSKSFQFSVNVLKLTNLGVKGGIMMLITFMIFSVIRSLAETGHQEMEGV